MDVDMKESVPEVVCKDTEGLPLVDNKVTEKITVTRHFHQACKYLQDNPVDVDQDTLNERRKQFKERMTAKRQLEEQLEKHSPMVAKYPKQELVAQSVKQEHGQNRQENTKSLSGTSRPVPSYPQHVPKLKQVPEKQVDEGDLKMRYFNVMFAKPSARKHKKFDDDGYLYLCGSSVTLKNEDGLTLGSSYKFQLENEHIEDGKTFIVGGKEVQIQDELKADPL